MRNYIYSIISDRRKGFAVPAVKAALLVLSLFFLIAVKIRGYLYKLGILRCFHLSSKVISVGNITLGGVGKTPIVRMIAEYIQGQDKKPAVLLRGYMKDKEEGIIPSDEAMLLESSLRDVPVAVGKDRVKGAKKILDNSRPYVFWLDDGFQHWRIYRDLDIVAIDATNPFGNGYLLPRGILREPFGSLARADVFIITKCDFGRKNIAKIRTVLTEKSPNAAIVETVHSPEYFLSLYENENIELSFIKGKTVCLFCGIGDPVSFNKTVITLGAQVEKHFFFSDHHWYAEKDIEKIVSCCLENNIFYVVTTKKDAVKLEPFKRVVGDKIRVLVLEIKIKILSGESSFSERINNIL